MSLGSRYGGTATFGGGIRGLNLVNSRRCVVYSNVRRDFARSEVKKTIHNSPEREKTETKGRRTREDGLQRRWLDSVNCATDFTGRRDVAVVSQNILGDHNAAKHRDLYLNIPFDYMKWDRRKELILQDIYQLNANIVCLQEVDKYHDLLDFMRKEGYTGTFKRRTGGFVDGCALFWREDEFNLLEEESIEFKNFHLRDNIAQLCIFETRKGNTRRFLVGNIHVLFNPNSGEIKLGQVRILLQKAHALAEKRGGIPVMLAGDFNCTPQSAVYEFLSTSELELTSLDRNYLSGQKRHDPLPLTWPKCLDHSWTNEELKKATGQSGCMQLVHPMKLQSAYASVKDGSSSRGPEGEPLATTYHSKFLGTVDYIWYSAGLSPMRVLDTPSLSNLRKIDGLPCQEIGSDHLALACDFVFSETILGRSILQ